MSRGGVKFEIERHRRLQNDFLTRDFSQTYFGGLCRSYVVFVTLLSGL